MIEPVRGGLGAVRQRLVAGEVNQTSRTPDSWWSNRLVLPGLSVVTHLKLDGKEKLEFLSETASLRGRNMDGAVLIGAILPKVDFTGASLQGAALDWATLQGAWLDEASLQGASLVGASLQGAWLDRASLQGASLNGASLQGASLDGASLQGASLDGASLQGASLFGASLQGASLDGASLQGASLDGASLQGASLNGASLQGASLDEASLQGASLYKASLQGASLVGAFVWRAVGSHADVTNTYIANLDTRAFADCGKGTAKTDCPWTHDDFLSWRAELAAQVPEGESRKDMLKKIDETLDPASPFKAAILQWKDWQDKWVSPGQAEAERAKQLGIAGCLADGPAVITALIARMSDDLPTTHLFRQGSNRATLARAFLAPECAGARGLASAQITALQRFAAGPADPAAK